MFIDLDGTLLDSRLTVSSAVRTALRDVAKRVSIVLATGRSGPVGIPVARDLFDDPGYLIVCNGGAILDLRDGSARSLGAFEQDLLSDLLAAAAGLTTVATCLYTARDWYVPREHYELADRVLRMTERPIPIPDRHAIGDRVLKVLFAGEVPEDLAVVELRVAPLVAGGSVNAMYTYPDYYEVMPKAVAKGVAARRVMAELGAEARDCVAIGDGRNDIDLFRVVGTSVAMENADDAAKAAADLIAPSHDADGVAVALRALFLDDEAAAAALRISGDPR